MRRAALGSAAILAVTVGAGWVVVWQAQHRWLSEQRERAGQVAAAAAFTLEQQVSRSLSATYTLAALVMRDERAGGFDEFAAWLFPHFGRGVVSLQLAPGAIISRIYPLAGNEAAMGRDLLHDPDRRFQGIEAVNTRTLTVAGPFELRQGGVGLVGRLAVYLPDLAAPGGERFWGLVTVVVRVKPLLEATQLARLETAGYRYQLTWKNLNQGTEPQCFAGCEVPLDAPVAFNVSVPNGSWTLLVAPRDGWPAPPWRVPAWILVCAGAAAAALFSYQVLRLPLLLHREVEARTADLRDTNERLEVSEKEKALILNSTSDIVTFLDPDMKIQWGNRQAAAFARTTLDGLRGRHCFEAFHARSAPCAGCPVALALETGEPQTSEMSHPGEEIFLRAYPVRDEQGQLIGVVEFSLDITERKHAEEALRESEARGRTILASLAEGVVLHNAEGRVTTANEAAERLLGVSAQEMAGRTVFDSPPGGRMLRSDGSLLPPEDHPVTLALRTGRMQKDVDLGMRRSDESVTWLSVNVRPVSLPGGKVAGVVSSFFDVTQRRQALRRSQEHLQTMADNVPDAIVRFDRELRVLFANQVAAAAPPEQAEFWDQHLLQVFATGLPDRIEFGHRGAEVRHYESRLIPERGRDGKVESVLSITRDITERTRIERELLASREELHALVARLNSVREEEKARLSQELHDEMGQLLTALRMELEALEDALGDLGIPAVRDLLERAVAASELVAGAIDSMRNILATLRPIVLDRLGLGAALRQECRRFKEWAGVTCEFVAAKGLSTFGPEVDTALFRIAQEAMTNVARHARASRVAVTLERRNGAAVLRVTDDGRGIPDRRESTGLGLLGMRERAERLGGELVLQAPPHGGTVVEARIPIGSSRPGEGVS